MVLIDLTQDDTFVVEDTDEELEELPDIEPQIRRSINTYAVRRRRENVQYVANTDTESDSDFIPARQPGYISENSSSQPINRLPHRPHTPQPDIAEIEAREYDAKLSRSLSTATVDQLNCGVCLFTVRVPHRGKCGHVFCGGCVVGRVRSCPMCRDDWSTYKPVRDRILIEILKDLSN